MANTSFAQLKRNRQSSFEKLNTEVAKLEQKQAPKEDDRFWRAEVDKAGNGYAVIRFLPAPPGEDVPFVRVWDHGFKGPDGSWYIEKSRTTLGEKDPVSEYNAQLWATGTKENQAIVRKQKRRLYYVSNIYVVSDKAHPENEGKVFLFQYGKKIWDKINAAMNPEFEDETPINPFDMWEGANFKLKIRQVEGYRNYDSSVFDTAGPLLDDDAALEALWKTEHSLQEFLDPKTFKPYAELEARLFRVLGLNSKPSDQEEAPEEAPKAAKSKKAAKLPEVPVDDTTAEINEDDISFFRKLASEPDED